MWSGTGAVGCSAAASVARPNASYTRFDLGAVARYTVAFAGLVVFGERLFEHRYHDFARCGMRDAGCVDVLEHRFQGVKCTSGVTLSVRHQSLHALRTHASRIPHLASRLLEGSPQDRPDVVVLQGLQDEYATPRQQRAPELEARVLGRSADQGDRAVLDPREEGVLLRLVEVVDLVAEQDRAPPLVLEPLRRLLDDLPHPSHAFRDCRERLQVAIGVIGDDSGERRLSRARRPPEDAGSDLAPADQLAQ